MKIPKVLNKSVILEAISKVSESNKVDISQEIAFASHSLDVSEIIHTENSIYHFLSEEASMLNDVDQTPSFNTSLSSRVRKIDLSIQNLDVIDCAPPKSKKEQVSKMKYWGIPVAIGLMGLIYLSKKKN